MLTALILIGSKPAFLAYTVRDRGSDKTPFWTQIGAVFPHRNGEGYSVVLEALPLNGRIELVVPREGASEPGEPMD